MANNRMYLVHIPTGLAVFLGKRMSSGWYTAKEELIGPDVQKLFEVLESQEYYYANRPDDFAIALDHSDGASLAVNADRDFMIAREDGLIQLIVPYNPTDRMR